MTVDRRGSLTGTATAAGVAALAATATAAPAWADPAPAVGKFPFPGTTDLRILARPGRSPAPTTRT
ncbi:hypothetical protein [Nocardia sp. NPDC020380]|uniref:hypothetical protein n=1 Tax=Nocardia sp. NPDC020380 TaxID=3364309 RepID=UPI00378CDE9E